jgi:hypothetical protein
MDEEEETFFTARNSIQDPYEKLGEFFFFFS